MKKFVFSLGVVILALLAAESVLACKCYGRTSMGDSFQPCTAYWSSAAVFVGTAQRLDVDKKEGSMLVTFSVEKKVRGEIDEKIEIVTSGDSASCGYPFKQGEKYLVYAHKGPDGKLREALCGPTVRLSEAERDLAYADEIAAGKTGTMLYGSVKEDWQPTLQDKRSLEPVSNVEIVAVGQDTKKRYTTRSDDRGLYAFREIVPDIYRVTANFPSGLRELKRPNEVGDRHASVRLDGARCDGEFFTVTRQGSITGKVANWNAAAISNPWSSQPAQPFLTLLALDADNKVLRSQTQPDRWAYQPKLEFFFPTVPAGNYLLVMNPTNCPYPNNGVQRAYYPGVSTEAEARIITVKDGEAIKLSDFRSFPLLKEKWLAGTVLNADRTPSANVDVRLRMDTTSTCRNGEVKAVTDSSGKFRIKTYESYPYVIDAILPRRNGQNEMYAPPIRLAEVSNPETIELVLGKPPWR